MLKELTKSEWLSLLNIPENRIPTILVLRGTRNLKVNYAKHSAFFTDVFEVGSPNGIFEDVLIGTYKNINVGYASVYGDAMASEVTHLFGVLGTSLVIQTGCCGALIDSIQSGDLVCVTSAYCGEGAAQYYLPQIQEINASLELVEGSFSSSTLPVAIHKGRIWTTSALLAEGKAEIQEWSDQGYIAVDMETASTFAVAEYFGMQRLSLLFVFDNPAQGEHILLSDVEKQKRRSDGEQAVIEAVFAIIEDYENGNR
jgi:purine-nucleoside phosphorylase